MSQALSRLRLFLPLLIFILLATFFVVVQKRIQSGDYDPAALPSALLDRPLPAFDLRTLPDEGRMTHADWRGEVALVNVWATWCPSCHAEHPYLMTLQARGIVIHGVNYKDDDALARQWLERRGNPYRSVVADPEGRLGLDLGVTGAPETYVIDAEGRVRLRYQGPLDEFVWAEHFEPLLQRLQGEAG